MEQPTKKVKLENEADKKEFENAKNIREIQNKGENDNNKTQNRGEKDNKEGDRIFLVREGIQEKRYGVIQKFAAKNGFICEEELSDR